MNRLWQEIAQHNNYAVPEDAKRFYYSIIKVITIILQKEGKIRLPDFGTFYLKKVKGKRMHDVNTGNIINISEKMSIMFVPAKGIKDHFRRLDDEGRLEIK